MVEEQEATLGPEKVAPAKAEKVRVVVYMTAEGYERVKKWADSCADEGLIEGHPGAISPLTLTIATKSLINT